MEGGGFSADGGGANTRNSGVLPVNSHIILASQGINAAVTYNDHQLGAVQRYKKYVETNIHPESRSQLIFNSRFIEYSS